MFPDKFELENNEVRIARNKEPWPHPPGLPYPYDTKGWREVGITAELAAEVCILSGHPCLVMHNTTLIYERYPEGWTKDLKLPMVCFNIWGDHGFFYQRSATDSICHKKVMNPKHLTDKELFTPFDEDLQTSFKSMVQFTTFDEFFDAIDQKKNIHFGITES